MERGKRELLLLLDAGNSLTGDRDPAQKTLGQSSVTAMNMMGYDAMALGPRDLALGLQELRQRIVEAEFTVLSANAVVSATGELVASPYILRQVDDHKIAIIGLSGGRGTQEIVVRDPLDTTQAVAAEAATQADIVILLSHAGTPTDQQIAEAVPGIDLIISGGEFQLTTPWQDDTTGTLILHADASSPGHAGRRLGIARLIFDVEGQLVSQRWQRLDLRPEIASDPTMTSWVQTQKRQQGND